MLNLTIESRLLQETVLVLPPEPVESGNMLNPRRGDPRRRRHNPAIWMNEFQWQHYVRFQELVRRFSSLPRHIGISRRVRFWRPIAFGSSGDDGEDANSGDAHALLGISRRCAK